MEQQDLVFVGSVKDNLLKIFRIDTEFKGLLIELRSRRGASQGIKKIRFYRDRFIVGLGDQGNGELVKFSVFNDNSSSHISTKLNRSKDSMKTELTRKTNDITDFCFSEIFNRQFNNLFTIHSNSAFPLFWDLEDKTIQNVFLELKSEYRENFDKKYADKINRYRFVTSIESSHCGNYLFVGYSDGLLLKLSA